ncbi:ABC transporter ATP-binding protein [Acidisoma silvae]|uniref:ABC transporter ATP-binding protein n=1 Tax=Acidisoma silvae TaxID=2802396 RepID=A0A964E1F8_9PROT|nr:ABC transporter ATP-binding protein [Acidisoma silvae]MCB8878189.1 ABC transporter ATP-binding protein [Acidisoma silvae]
MTQPLLEVRDLRVDFRGEMGTVSAVSGISFTVQKGETLVIVGESGSGKSVTSLAVMGLIPQPPGRIAGGEILFHARDGQTHDLAKADARTMQHLRGAEIAMIFQEPMTALNPVYTIGAQIVETIRLHEPLSRRAARLRAIDMLALLGVPEPQRRFDAYPHELSGGLRQRAMIAMALACSPSLLIADEPTTALDVTVQAQILDMIARLQKELSMGVIFITHNLGVAAEIADRVLVMYAGQTVEAAPAADIFQDPRMPYTRGLLKSIPRLGMDRDAGPLPTIPGTVPNLGEMPRGCAFHPRCTHALPDPCMARRPDLEPVTERHVVRCARWRDIAGQPA